MKFSFTRNHAAVLITLLFVIFLGASYFFIYIPNNEKSLQEQRFRALQNIEKNIHAKIENSVALMNNLLKDSVDTAYIKYLSNRSKKLFTLSIPENQPRIIKDITDSGYTITVNNVNRQIILLLTKQHITKKDTTNYQMAMQWSFEQFMESLLHQNVFDQYIIFSDGQVVYETFPSGMSYLKDSLSGMKNGIISSTVRALNVSGTDFKLFSQPVNFSSNNEWAITGLLSNKRYQQEKTQLPANGVLLLVTVLLIIIVVYPWIKLYQMGNKDRLTIIDGISSIVVSMLLMSLLFFTFFKYNFYLRPGSNANPQDTLAIQITAAFQKELHTAYEKLRSFDDSLQHHPALFSNDIINLDKDSIRFSKIKYRNDSARDSLKTLQAIATTISINQVFWLDENGTEKIRWTTESMNSPHGNFKSRDYFKKIIPTREYILNNDTSQRFYLDQIISWTSGSFTSVVSVPSKVPGKKIAAMSFNMRSVYKPVLPDGYQFAIIDNSGKVLYHSDPARNLNENLVTEFSENENLTGCMESRTEGSFRTKYFSKEYNVSVKPIEKLPYFIVIFGDTSYRETRDMEVYSFTFSMLLLLFGFLIFQLFVVFLVSSKRSFFRKQLHDTSWIGPKSSSHHQYNLAVLFNVVVIVLIIAFFRISTFLTYLFILLFSVTSISIFLNSLFAKRYKKIEQNDNYKFKITTRRWLLIFVFIIDVAAIRTLDWSSIYVLLAYELLTAAAGWITLRMGRYYFSKDTEANQSAFSFSIGLCTKFFINGFNTTHHYKWHTGCIFLYNFL